MDRELYNTFVEILEQELVSAMGCTEPIAVAYAGAIARETLGKMPEAVIATEFGHFGVVVLGLYDCYAERSKRGGADEPWLAHRPWH